MNYRNLFDGVNNPIKLENGRFVVPINFDNGATTPPLKSAVATINSNIKNYASIGRGAGPKADFCTKKFEEAREDILEFFHVKETTKHTVVFVKSTTEGLNLLASVLIKDKKELVLTTRMEHHANDLPWRYASRVDYVDVDDLGRIRMEDIERKLMRYRGQVKYVSITAASNVTGYINDINKIAKICHKYGAKIVVDGAQIVAHQEVNMQGECEEEQIDFLVFSAHKAYAPFGSGAVVGLKEYLADVEPFLKGGGIVEHVYDDSLEWNRIPERLEAGTQNFLGVIAMARALKDLKSIGFDNIALHEKQIKEHLFSKMKEMEHVILYGDTNNIDDRLGIICFNVIDNNFETLAEDFAKQKGISMRYGKFCAHPYCDRLLGERYKKTYKKTEEETGMIRISLGLYNTMEEANVFLKHLSNCHKN